MTNCPSCAFAFQPTSTPPQCPACGAVAPAPGGFAPPPMGGMPGQGAYAPGGFAPGPQGYGPQGYGPQPYGPVGYGGMQHGAPRDLDVGWLLWGAISMVFCCQPMGIAAIVLMDQAKTAYRLGDDAKSQSKLQSMRTCIYVGIGLAVALILVYVGIIIVAAVATAASRP